MTLDAPIEHLYLVGQSYAKRLAKLDIYTVGDLLFHFPTRYLDYRLVSKIGAVQSGETVTVQGQIQEMKNIFTKSGKKIQKGIIADETGQIDVIWFNQPFLSRVLRKTMTVNLSGKVDWFGSKITLQSPEYEILKPTTNLPVEALAKTGDQFTRRSLGEDGRPTTIHTGRLVPIYPETYGVSSKWLRSRINAALKLTLPELEDYLPPEIQQTYGLTHLSDAIAKIHFPQNEDENEKARHRLAFDELFKIQLFSLYTRQNWEKEVIGNQFMVDQEKVLSFISRLPFELTNAQKKAIKEILSDLGQKKPMNRLLEGDVGSGKTVVAAIAMFVAFMNGYKSLIMAPTEILAEQHFRTISTLLSPEGVKIELLTGTTKPKKANNIDVTVGTHALLWGKDLSNKVGLVVIDEQHRFGVEQRQQLKEKGINPHLLSMTATPIPRTTALTLYGELDLSLIDEMPKGRQTVKTWVVPKEKRANAYEWARKVIRETSGQIFIICPLIEESETLLSTKAVKKEFKYIRSIVFSDFKVGLLHGKLTSKEKQKIITQMKERKIDILVSTPVVEVGIDIPNATIMIIEGSERFGLAQLHQLRGRVGRGDKQSYCLLFTESDREETLTRLKSMEKNFIGARLAEIDLELRGPGEIYGTRQHGRISLKIASLTDKALLDKTKEAANFALTHLDSFPLLRENLNKGKIEKPIMKGD